MKDIVNAFKIISGAQHGNVKNLIKDIGLKMYQHLVAMGFIKEHQTVGNAEKLWKLTAAGKTQAEFYREPTALEKEDGRLLAGLGV